MALPATCLDYRIALAHVDRDAQADGKLIVARHPSETAEHLTLRVLAWCLLYEEQLDFGPGLSEPDAPDLCARDLQGQIATWIECGNVAPDRLKKLVQHHPRAAVHVLLDDERRLRELGAAVAAWPRAPRGLERVTIWSIPPALVAALLPTARRNVWSVTVVGDHLYVEADGRAVDGAATPTRLGA